MSQKKDFLAHFESCFVYALLHPINYAPRFCELKDLIKIQFYGRFNQYIACGCEV